MTLLNPLVHTKNIPNLMIQKIGTNLFSTGGQYPLFKKRGKIWNIGNLKNHLNCVFDYWAQYQRYRNKDDHDIQNIAIYENECKIVIFQGHDLPLLDFKIFTLKDYFDKKRENYGR